MLRTTCLTAIAAGFFIGCQGPATTRLPPERTATGVVIQPQRDPAAEEVRTDPPPPTTEPIPARAPEQHLPPRPDPADPAEPDPEQPRGVVPPPQPGPTVTEPAPGPFPQTIPGDEPAPPQADDRDPADDQPNQPTPKEAP